MEPEASARRVLRYEINHLRRRERVDEVGYEGKVDMLHDALLELGLVELSGSEQLLFGDLFHGVEYVRQHVLNKHQLAKC